MKAKILTALFVLSVLGMCPALWPDQQPDMAARGGITMGGAASTDDRVSTETNPQLTYQEYRLEITGDAKPSDKPRLYAEAWLRSAGTSSNVTSAADLFTLGRVAPVALDLLEAWFELKGFIFDNVDLKIGRQRVAWGTADRLNPTDNVNAYDLTDIWDFGRHLGSDGVQLSVYAGGLQLTGLAIPVFTPAVLPQGAAASALTSTSSTGFPGMTVSGVTTSVVLPSSSLADSLSAGLKVSGNLLGYDLSVSYLYGRQGLPIVDKTVVTPTGASSVAVASELIYPREHIFGADLAGSLWGVGVWAEAALFLPEKVTLTADLSALTMGVQQSVALDSAPFVKYAIGGDYTFPANIYINAQYLHGFVQEAGQGNLKDYFVVNVDWRLLEDRIKLTPINVVVEVSNWNDVSNNHAILAAPSITLHPVDNAELVIGVHWIQATSSTAYAGMSGKNEVFAHARYSF